MQDRPTLLLHLRCRYALTLISNADHNTFLLRRVSDTHVIFLIFIFILSAQLLLQLTRSVEHGFGFIVGADYPITVIAVKPASPAAHAGEMVVEFTKIHENAYFMIFTIQFVKNRRAIACHHHRYQRNSVPRHIV